MASRAAEWRRCPRSAALCRGLGGSTPLRPTVSDAPRCTRRVRRGSGGGKGRRQPETGRAARICPFRRRGAAFSETVAPPWRRHPAKTAPRLTPRLSGPPPIWVSRGDRTSQTGRERPPPGSTRKSPNLARGVPYLRRRTACQIHSSAWFAWSQGWRRAAADATWCRLTPHPALPVTCVGSSKWSSDARARNREADVWHVPIRPADGQRTVEAAERRGKILEISLTVS